jgi:hypothetical protein
MNLLLSSGKMNKAVPAMMIELTQDMFLYEATRRRTKFEYLMLHQYVKGQHDLLLFKKLLPCGSKMIMINDDFAILSDGRVALIRVEDRKWWRCV